MESVELSVETGRRETVHDLTSDCARFVRDVAPALVPPYATVPVLDGRLGLGTWQRIALVDLNVDNVTRAVRLSFLSG